MKMDSIGSPMATQTGIGYLEQKINLDGDLIPSMPPAKAIAALAKQYPDCSVRVERCMRFGSLTHALYMLWVCLDGPDAHAERATCWLVFRDEQVNEGTESQPVTLSDVVHLLGNITDAEMHTIGARKPGNPTGACFVTELQQLCEREHHSGSALASTASRMAAEVRGRIRAPREDREAVTTNPAGLPAQEESP